MNKLNWTSGYAKNKEFLKKHLLHICASTRAANGHIRHPHRGVSNDADGTNGSWDDAGGNQAHVAHARVGSSFIHSKQSSDSKSPAKLHSGLF